jgi:hypothetical protein
VSRCSGETSTYLEHHTDMDYPNSYPIYFSTIDIANDFILKKDIECEDNFVMVVNVNIDEYWKKYIRTEKIK